MAGSDASSRPSYDPQTLLNAQPVMVTVIDPASYVVQFQNETGLKQLGDISGRTCHEGIAGCPTPCAFCKMPEAVQSGQVTINEVALPNNQHLLVQWSKAVTNEGRLHVIETITDVTAQKRLEETAHKVEKMEALSRLAGGMAHDINNLLTVITGASEQVSNETDGSGSMVSPIRQIQGAVDRAAELTRKLVAFSHHQVVRPTFLDLNTTLHELVPHVKGVLGERILLEMALHPGPATVMADRQQIEQTVMVLVMNARDAMPQGGRLTVSTVVGSLSEEAAEERAVKPGTYVRIAIHDRGCGIAPEVQPHLFEPFFVRAGEATGRGLGLASVYGMVRQNGGFIDVVSERDVGTVFTVGLPWSEPLQPLEALTSASPVSDGRPRILLVEDDGDVRMAVQDMLKSAGFEVHEASDGMDALERLQEMMRPPSLIITDVMMPRMTGPQLAKQVHETMPGTRVLFMSGYSDQILEPVGNSPFAFIAKPFRATDLIKTIRAILA